MSFKSIFSNVMSSVFAPKTSLLMVGMSVGFVIAKAIVTATPNKVDDEILDRVHKLALGMVPETTKNEEKNA